MPFSLRNRFSLSPYITLHMSYGYCKFSFAKCLVNTMSARFPKGLINNDALNILQQAGEVNILLKREVLKTGADKNAMAHTVSG